LRLFLPRVILARRDSDTGDVEHMSLDVIDGVDPVAWTRHWNSQTELEEV
jgi:hypothetical protein